MSEHSYSVYEPALVRRNLAARADDMVFVRDGFSVWAMLMPVLWLLYHRLWLPLLGLIAAFAVVQGVAWLAGISGESASGLLSMGLSVAFGFLANDIRRYWLERQNYKLVATVVGASELDCERRFFDNWQPLLEAGRDGAEARS